jgi:hypothetical protein
MAKNETKRVVPSILNQDRAVYAAVKGNAKYAPSNQAYAQAQLDAEHDALTQAEHEAVQAEGAAAAARDKLVAQQWSFHNRMLGVKAQVVAQFGADSDEAQALELKKKSEYKAPKRPARPAKDGK